MGRNKKKNQKQQLLVETKSEANLQTTSEEQKTETSKEVKQSSPGKKQATDLFNKPPEEVKKTPQDKTDEYVAQQKATHDSFLNKFKKEEEIINQQPESNEAAQKEIFSKSNGDQLKAFEKTLKKEKNDFENISGTGQTNVKAVHDRATKTLKHVKTTVGQLADTRRSNAQQLNGIEEKEKAIASFIKKKDFNAKLCESLMKKMANLYLQHEVMLDDENTARQEMAEQFNKRMADLSAELNKRKEDRMKHAEHHNTVRSQIQTSIDDYKVKEQEYKDYMETMNKEVE